MDVRLLFEHLKQGTQAFFKLTDGEGNESVL